MPHQDLTVTIHQGDTRVCVHTGYFVNPHPVVRDTEEAALIRGFMDYGSRGFVTKQDLP